MTCVVPISAPSSFCCSPQTPSHLGSLSWTPSAPSASQIPTPSAPYAGRPLLLTPTGPHETPTPRPHQLPSQHNTNWWFPLRVIGIPAKGYKKPSPHLIGDSIVPLIHSSTPSTALSCRYRPNNFVSLSKYRDKNYHVSLFCRGMDIIRNCCFPRW